MLLGELLTIKVAGEDTDGAYTIVQNVSPPSGGPPLHLHHREDEAFYVLEGEYEIQSGDDRINATPVRSSSPQGRYRIHSAKSAQVGVRFW
jgi:uncharacterized cupin superfamily protein